MKRPTRTKLLLAISVTLLAIMTGCSSDKKLVTDVEKPPKEEPVEIVGFKLDSDLIEDDNLREVMNNVISVAIMESAERFEYDQLEILNVDLIDTVKEGYYSGGLTGLAFKKDEDKPSELIVEITDNAITSFHTLRANISIGSGETSGYVPDIFNTYETPHGQKIVIFSEAFADEDVYWKFSEDLFDEIEELIKDYKLAELEIYNTELTINSNDKFDGVVFADLVYGDLLETFNLTIEDGKITDVERHVE